MEALAKQVISPDEWRCLMVILRKTYGWHKKEDWISHTQFSNLTGMARHHVPRVLKKLLKRNIIIKSVTQLGNPVTRTGNSCSVSYGFQKNFEKWMVLPKQVTVLPKQDRGVTQTGFQALPKQVTTKERTTKEKLQKKETLPGVKIFIDFYYQEFQKTFGKSPIIQGGKDGLIIKSLLKDIPLEELRGLLLRMFESDDKFIVGSGYTLGVFKSQINKLRIGRIVEKDPLSGLKLWAEEIREEEGGE